MIFLKKKIKFLRSKGIKHNNIIIDPGIGFGKKLKHNMNLIRDISIFHTLVFLYYLDFLEKNLLKIYLEKMILRKEWVEQLHLLYTQ